MTFEIRYISFFIEVSFVFFRACYLKSLFVVFNFFFYICFSIKPLFDGSELR